MIPSMPIVSDAISLILNDECSSHKAKIEMAMGALIMEKEGNTWLSDHEEMFLIDIVLGEYTDDSTV